MFTVARLTSVCVLHDRTSVSVRTIVISSVFVAGNTWLSEALYLVHSDGDFETAKAVKHYDRYELNE